MFRISIERIPQAVTLRLEGRLEGPWKTVLSECWSKERPNLQGCRICVNLNGVTFVDVQGKAQLAEMYGQGAELLGDGLETRALVAEIQASARNPGKTSSNEAFSVSDQLAQLQPLQVELQKANEAFSKAALPLKRLEELNSQQRQQVGDAIRAALARWESVTQRISQVLGTEGAEVQQFNKSNQGESR